MRVICLGKGKTEVCLTSINTNVFGQELKAGTKLVLGKRRIVILSHLLTDTGFFKERLWDIFYILCVLAFISIQLCLYSVCLVLFRIPEPHPQIFFQFYSCAVSIIIKLIKIMYGVLSFSSTTALLCYVCPVLNHIPLFNRSISHCNDSMLTLLQL